MSLGLSALGALLLLSPGERLPEDPRSYRAVTGVLSGVRDQSPRRSTWVVFTLEGNETQFVSTSPPVREAAKVWVVGQTKIRFFVLNQTRAGLRFVPAYGINAQSRDLRSLEEDIEFHNAGVNPLGGLLALVIGGLGLLVAAKGCVILRKRSGAGGVR